MSWLTPQTDKGVASNADTFNLGFQQGATGAREAAVAEAEAYKQKIAKEAAIAVNDADNIRALREKEMALTADALKDSHDQMERILDTNVTDALKVLGDPLAHDATAVTKAEQTVARSAAEKSRLAEMRRTMQPWSENEATSSSYFPVSHTPSLGATQKFTAEANKEVLDAEQKKRVLAAGTYPGGPNDGKSGASKAGGTGDQPIVADLRSDETTIRQFGTDLANVSGNLATYSQWDTALRSSQEHLEHLHKQSGYDKVPEGAPKDNVAYWKAVEKRDKAAIAVNQFKKEFNPKYSAAVSGIQKGYLDGEVPEAKAVMTEVLAKVPGNVYSVENYRTVIDNLITMRKQYEQVAVNSVPSSTEKRRLNAVLAILQRLGADTMGGGQ